MMVLSWHAGATILKSTKQTMPIAGLSASCWKNMDSKYFQYQIILSGRQLQIALMSVIKEYFRNMYGVMVILKG
jgi:hypothetical protein